MSYLNAFGRIPQMFLKNLWRHNGKSTHDNLQGFFIVSIKPANFRLSSFSLNHYRNTAKCTGREETHNKHKLKFITDAQYTNCHTDMTSVCTWTVNTNACTGTKRRQQQKYSFVFLTAHLPAPLISFLFTWLLQSMSYYRTLTINPTHLRYKNSRTKYGCELKEPK